MRMLRVFLLAVIILLAAHLSFGSTFTSYGTWSIEGTASGGVSVTATSRYTEAYSELCPWYGSCLSSDNASSTGGAVAASNWMGSSGADGYAGLTDPIVGWGSYYVGGASATPAGTQTTGYGSGSFWDATAAQTDDGSAFHVDLIATIPVLSLWGAGQPDHEYASFDRGLAAYGSDGAKLAYFDLWGYFEIGGPLNVYLDQLNTGWTADVAGAFRTAIGAEATHNSFSLSEPFIFPSISLDLPEGRSLTLDAWGYNAAQSWSELAAPVAPVPEPGTLMLLGTGLLGTAGLIRRKIAG